MKEYRSLLTAFMSERMLPPANSDCIIVHPFLASFKNFKCYNLFIRMTSLSVLLPTYNEAENVLELIEQIPDIPAIFEILVIDDDSPDQTWKVVSKDHRVRMIRRVGERGLVGALNRGIQEAHGETITWLDADGSMPPDLIPDMLEAKTAADIVIASRYVAGGSDSRKSSMRRFTSRAINRFAGKILKTRIHDCTTGYVLCDRSWLLEHPLQGVYGDYCIRFLIQAERAGLKIHEIGFENKERIHGTSKTDSSFFSFLRLGAAYLETIWELRP